MDNYVLVRVQIDREVAPQVESAMLEFGALSCTFEDAGDKPIHEPAPGQVPLWEKVIVSGMFPQNHDASLLASLLQNEIPELKEIDIATENLQGQVWERAWMEHFEPQHVAGNLWVVPSFCDPPDADAVNLAIDPGLAFGSGTHATTFLCLQWLTKQKLAGKTVIDYGCGSGILAIAAVLLGAREVFAYDIDQQALIATDDNATRNGVADRIQICSSDRDLDVPADVLVANILLAPLLELSGRFSELLKTDGALGVSGVLSEQAGTLAGAYASHFQHSATEMREQWILYSARKNGIHQI
jgi:ribosomal protein L11 methyltransferase